jgi:hypothetical protein
MTLQKIAKTSAVVRGSSNAARNVVLRWGSVRDIY